MAKNKNKNSEEAKVDGFEPKMTVTEQADKCLEESAAILKLTPARIKESRESRMKVKVHSLNTIDTITSIEGVSDDEKAYWKRVKLDISVR